MHESAKNQIIEYLTEFEGFATWMYLDSIGKVTTGIGVLLDPFESFGKAIPKWHNKDTNQPATDEEVQKDFKEVKSKRGADGRPLPQFVNFNAFAPITNLRATDGDVRTAVMKIVDIKEGECKRYFSDFNTFPADVQVTLVQMAYGGGLNARKNDLAPLLAKRDWLAAADYTYLTNPAQGKNGYIKYNLNFQQMMLNAYIVESCSKLSNPNPTMPRDPTQFFGYKLALNVARWSSSNDLDLTIRPDDIITGGNIIGWLRKKALEKK